MGSVDHIHTKDSYLFIDHGFGGADTSWTLSFAGAAVEGVGPDIGPIFGGDPSCTGCQLAYRDNGFPIVFASLVSKNTVTEDYLDHLAELRVRPTQFHVFTLTHDNGTFRFYQDNVKLATTFFLYQFVSFSFIGHGSEPLADNELAIHRVVYMQEAIGDDDMSDFVSAMKS